MCNSCNIMRHRTNWLSLKKKWHKYTERHAAHSQCCNPRYSSKSNFTTTQHYLALFLMTTLVLPTQYPSGDNVVVRVTSRLTVGQSGVLMSLYKCYCLSEPFVSRQPVSE